MGKYHQLTEYQRYQIYALKKVGHDQQTIASTIEVSPSTIFRELRRNRGQRGYRPRQAHQKALTRRRLEAAGGFRLSAERIYQHIRAGRQAGGTLYQPLRHSQKKRYGKPDAREQIKDRVSIDQRPAIVEGKSRIGDWKIDRVMGGKRQGVLVSLVERRSRYTLLGKVISKHAEQHIMDRLNHRPRKGLAFQTPHEILYQETGFQPGQSKIALTS